MRRLSQDGEAREVLRKAGGRRNTGCEFSVRLVMNTVLVISSDREDIFLTGFPSLSLGLGRNTERILVSYSVGKRLIIYHYSRDVQCGRWKGAI